MTAAEKVVRLEIGGAKIKIPEATVLRVFLESLGREAAPSTIVLTGGIPRIGEVWPGQGGVNSGLMRGENGQRDYYLITATHPDAYIKEITWGARGEDEPNAKSEWDGYANTQALVLSKHSHPAAERIAALSIDGHKDFYLPSRRELRLEWVSVPELFEEGYYWSSTQYSPGYAWFQDFSDGGQLSYGKTSEFRARAVRRLFI